MWEGRNLWHIARNAIIFSGLSFTNSARPIAMADLYCRVKLPSLGPTVGVHLVTADSATIGFAAMQSNFSPSGAQWK